MMFFQRERGKNQYHPLLITTKFNFDLDINKQENEWVSFERSDDFYDMITEYYHDRPEEGVQVYQKGEIDSEDEGDTIISG